MDFSRLLAIFLLTTPKVSHGTTVNCALFFVAVSDV